MTSRLGSMQCSVRALSHLSLAFGLLACGTLSLAVSTDFWLHTSESFDPTAMMVGPSAGAGAAVAPNDTRAGVVGPAVAAAAAAASEVDSTVVLAAKMHSGLWRSCTSFDDELQEYDEEFFPFCTNIVYFGQDSERPEKAETTTSILRSIRKSSPVIVGSLFAMLTALSLSILGNSKSDARTLLAAIFYICAALSLAIGVIFYISAVNDEVSHRKKSMTTAERDGFSYRYGWAFFFVGSSFMCSMSAAVNNISLYLRRRSTIGELTSAKSEVLLPNRIITTPV